MLPILLALSLAATQGEPPDDDGGYDETAAFEDEEEDRPKLLVTLWGGQTFDQGDGSNDGGLLGGEVAYAFETLDLGLAAYGYRFAETDADPDTPGLDRETSPVLLVRVTQRFETRRGFEAALSFGLGGARVAEDWDPWFQVALGLRIPLGPVFLAGELAFEQDDLLKLAGGLGVRF